MRRFAYLATLATVFAISSVPAALHAQTSSAGSIAVSQPWARATPGGAQTGAAYLTINNASEVGDRLVGGSTPAAASLQIHMMKVSNGVMEMREISQGVPIPPRGSVAFSPSGYHLMLVDLNKPLKQGDTIQVTLRFDKAGAVQIQVPVLSIGARGPEQGARKSGMSSMEMK